eukprot:7644333-Pyramimonas_sp.AAC.1
MVGSRVVRFICSHVPNFPFLCLYRLPIDSRAPGAPVRAVPGRDVRRHLFSPLNQMDDGPLERAIGAPPQMPGAPPDA